MNKFAVIFTKFQQVHLTKDIGMIPIEVSQNEQFGKSIIFYKENESIINDYEQYVTLSPIKSRTNIIYYLLLLRSVVKSGVTHVNLYHLSAETFFLVLILKLISVKIYIKLDMGMDWCVSFERSIERNKLSWCIKKKILTLVDVVTIESHSVYDRLIYHWPNSRLMVVPNSVSYTTIPKKINVQEFKDRTDVMLVVGRIGAYPKNHEMLLRVIRLLPYMKDWKIVFVGPIENAFQSEIEKFKSEGCINVDNVLFMGAVNRDYLFELYAKSKIFIMTSHWEGFSLAMVEAASMGLFVISTDVGGANEVTQNGRFGIIISDNDDDALTIAIRHCLNEDSRLEIEYKERVSYVRQAFNLKEDVNRLLDVMSQ